MLQLDIVVVGRVGIRIACMACEKRPYSSDGDHAGLSSPKHSLEILIATTVGRANTCNNEQQAEDERRVPFPNLR